MHLQNEPDPDLRTGVQNKLLLWCSSEMNEATRRILGVLLRQLDGFEGKHSIVIGATNRKQDLDAALRSRFSSSIHFQLPNLTCRWGTPPLCHTSQSSSSLPPFTTPCPILPPGQDVPEALDSLSRERDRLFLLCLWGAPGASGPLSGSCRGIALT